MNRLAGVHPVLIQKVQRVLSTMAAAGHPMLVTDGLRTAARQVALYAQGRTLPGRIVTHCDGLHTKSNHQPHADGFGYAVDCAFVVDGQPSWDEMLPWHLYGAAAKAEGLRWGGDWPAPKTDKPHCELA